MENYSVLMSVYAKEKAEYFEKSIESMLEQTIPTDDFVIMCDGPLTEELDSVLEKMTDKYPDLFQIVRLKTCGGLGNALKEGVIHCKNELIARMDSDDISCQDRCEKQLAVFEKEDVVIVGGNVTEFVQDISHVRSVRRVPKTNEEIRAFAKRRNPFNHPSVMFRKSVVLAAGNYIDCKGFEDYYLWVRILNAGYKGFNILETLVYMRTDAGLYERRGNLSYAIKGLQARWKIHKTGYSSLVDFIISSGAQVVMSLIPVKLRTQVYGKFLRK
ncbi:MAG: glycosyltransferase [Lachnospiraceae bacterium]|nr:glycosyltransferase [Lachnospiraceae bacterium]